MIHLKLQKLQKNVTLLKHFSPTFLLKHLGYVLIGTITFFVIFAVLNVLFAVNSCLNCSFFTFIIL